MGAAPLLRERRGAVPRVHASASPLLEGGFRAGGLSARGLGPPRPRARGGAGRRGRGRAGCACGGAHARPQPGPRVFLRAGARLALHGRPLPGRAAQSSCARTRTSTRCWPRWTAAAGLPARELLCAHRGRVRGRDGGAAAQGRPPACPARPGARPAARGLPERRDRPARGGARGPADMVQPRAISPRAISCAPCGAIAG